MATIRAYTDIEQSRKLAEILPLESADMHYSKDFDGSWFVDLAEYTSVKIPKYVGDIEEHLLPCWSLAALLNIIQKTTPYKMECFGDKKVQLICVLGDKPWELIISDFDNEVDACYEMILKLHEEDLL